MSGTGQYLFRGFGADAWSAPSWQNPSGAPGAGVPPPSGYVGPGSASGWTSDTAVDTSYHAQTYNTGGSEPVSKEAGFDWQGMTSGLGKGLLDIFRGTGGQQPMYQPPPQQGVPVWVWLAIPVALVGVVLIARKPKRSMAGYKRRKSRR